LVGICRLFGYVAAAQEDLAECLQKIKEAIGTAVLRGGSSNSNDNNCRVSNRNRNNPNNRNNNNGFRCASTAAKRKNGICMFTDVRSWIRSPR
jgi:hypothetical protein